MIKLNQIIFKKIFSFYTKYIYLLLFMLVISFTFTDLYLRDLIKTNTQLKKIELNFNLFNDESNLQLNNFTYHRLLKNIYSNLIIYKIKEDFDLINKYPLFFDEDFLFRGDISNIKKDLLIEELSELLDLNALQLNPNEYPLDISSVQKTILKTLTQSIKNDIFLTSNMRFGIEYIENQKINSGDTYTFYFDLHNKYNLEDEKKIKNDLFKSLEESLKSSFLSLKNELDLFNKYANFLMKKETFKTKTIIDHYNKLNLSYQDAKKAIDFYSTPKNYISAKVQNYNYEDKIPSFINTFLFTFILLNSIILVISYIYYFIKIET